MRIGWIYIGSKTVVSVFLCVAVLSTGCGSRSPEDLYSRGIKASDRGDYKKAIKEFEKFIKKYPDHNNVFLVKRRIAEVYLAAGNHAEALKSYENLAAEAKDSRQKTAALDGMLNTYCEIKNWIKALEIGKQLIDSAEDRGKINYMLRYGEILWKSGRKQQAKEYFKSTFGTIEDPAGRGAFLLTLGNLLRVDGETNECIEIYDEVASNESFTVEQRITALDGKGTVLYFADKPDEAVSTFAGIKKIFPEDYQACIRADTMIAQIHHRKGDDKLDADLDRIVEACSDRISSTTDPDEINRYRLLMADAFQKVKRYPEARAAFETVRKENPKQSYGWITANKRIAEIDAAIAGKTPVPDEHPEHK